MAGPDQPKLNQLLHWAVENSPQPPSSSTAVGPVRAASGQPQTAWVPTDTSNQSVSQSKKLDTGVLDAILGKQDAVRMREAMDCLDDPSKPIGDRCLAGELMEELIQDLDNANDMEVLGFWPRLMKLLELDSGHQQNDQLIKLHVCWICGTAVQNNPKSQIAFLKRDPLPVILGILSDADDSTQAKALYCLSSALKHAPPQTGALKAFCDGNGWEVLHGCLKGPSMTLRRKTVFLINTLFLEDSLDLDQLRSNGLFDTLINSLSPSSGIPAGPNGDLNCQDEDYTEKALRAIVTIILKSKVRSDQRLLQGEIDSIRRVLEEIGAPTDQFKSILESAGISQSEWRQVSEILEA